MWRTHFGFFVGTVGALLAIPPASSTGLHGHNDRPVNHNDEVSLELIGAIEPRCAITRLPGEVTLGDLTSPGGKDVFLTVDCNEHFGYQLASANGALTHLSSAISTDQFSTQLPYHIYVEIPTTGHTIRDSFNSAELVPGSIDSAAFSDSEGGVAFARTATLRLAWTAPEQPLLAGAYQDTLTLTLGARP